MNSIMYESILGYNETRNSSRGIKCTYCDVTMPNGTIKPSQEPQTCPNCGICFIVIDIDYGFTMISTIGNEYWPSLNQDDFGLAYISDGDFNGQIGLYYDGAVHQGRSWPSPQQCRQRLQRRKTIFRHSEPTHHRLKPRWFACRLRQRRRLSRSLSNRYVFRR